MKFKIHTITYLHKKVISGHWQQEKYFVFVNLVKAFERDACNEAWAGLVEILNNELLEANKKIIRSKTK